MDLFASCVERRRWDEAEACLDQGLSHDLGRHVIPLIENEEAVVWRWLQRMRYRPGDMPNRAACLAAACEADRADWVAELLGAGASPNEAVVDFYHDAQHEDTRFWYRPLAIAVAARELDCVRLLLEAGADANHVAIMSGRGPIPPWFHPANSSWQKGRPASFTPLMLAEIVGDDDVLRELRRHGADSEAPGHRALGVTDYHAARALRNPARWQTRAALRALRRGETFDQIAAKIATLPELDMALVHEASVRGRCDVLRLLAQLELIDSAGLGWPCWPLHELAAGGDEVVSILLENGYRRACDDHPTTLLAELCAVGDDVLLRKALEAGYPPDFAQRDRSTGQLTELTPLLQAVRVGATACVEALLEHGADVGLGVPIRATNLDDWEQLMLRGTVDTDSQERSKPFNLTPGILSAVMGNVLP